MEREREGKGKREGGRAGATRCEEGVEGAGWWGGGAGEAVAVQL